MEKLQQLAVDLGPPALLLPTDYEPADIAEGYLELENQSVSQDAG